MGHPFSRWSALASGFGGRVRGRIPKLEVDDTLDADLWDVVVVEEGVC